MSSKGGNINTGNKKPTLTKYFKAGLLVIKDKNDAQALIPQFNIYTDSQGNKYDWDRGADTTKIIKAYP